MADLAHGGTCPYCGTFNAFGGSKADKQISGQCGTCTSSYAIPNPSYDPGVAAVVAEKDAQIAALQAQIAESTAQNPAAAPAPASAPNVAVPQSETDGEATEDVDDAVSG